MVKVGKLLQFLCISRFYNTKGYKLFLNICYNFLNAGNYILIGLGEICKTQGLEPVGSEDECKSLTSIFRKHYPTIEYGWRINMNARPAGCYALTTESSAYFGIYFNAHESGGSDSRTRPLCKDLTGKAATI